MQNALHGLIRLNTGGEEPPSRGYENRTLKHQNTENKDWRNPNRRAKDCGITTKGAQHT